MTPKAQSVVTSASGSALVGLLVVGVCSVSLR